eukprot:2317730-Karenia_brevis.AAC.1
MQRLKAIQHSYLDGRWNTAKLLEIGTDTDISLVSDSELREAVAGQVVETKLAADAAKASSSRSRGHS